MNLRQVFGGIPLAIKVVAVVFLGLSGYVGYQMYQIKKLERELVAETIRANNELARADSTHKLLMGQRDSTDAWTKLAVQEKIRADDLDKRLKRETRAKADLQIRIDSLVAVIRGATTEDTAGTRYGVFPPKHAEWLTIGAKVALPKPPGIGTIEITAVPDPILIGVRQQCGLPDTRGVRQASVVVTGPRWATVTLGALVQDPGVCMPQIVKKTSSKFKLGAIFGAAATLLIILAAP